jgi:small-conductance mechanosensitive channel
MFTVTPTVWSVAILVAAAAGLLALRSLSKRLRIAFDVVCLVGMSLVLHERGATPLLASSTAALDTATLWLRVLVVAWWLLSARVVVGVLYFALRHDRYRPAKLVADLIAAAIYVGTVVIVLNSVLALPVSGLFATSGVVAIVLGLALQSTLADVFSGIAVGIEAPFQVGDRISLGDDIEGRIIETNWRSIRVQTDGDDIAIIPNSVMAKLQIVNRSVPSRRRAVSAELRCPAMVDPERVIQVLDEATLLCPDILETPASSVRLTRLGRRWNHYTISFSVAETSLMSGTKSLLLGQARKQLHYAGLLERDPGGVVQPPARSRG